MMNAPEFGIEEVVDPDRAYSGSRFAKVREAVFGDPYPGIWDVDGGRMPTHHVTLASLLRGLLPFGRNWRFRQAVARSIDSDAGQTRGLPIYQRREFQGWRRIGKLTFNNATVSYNGDFVLHFNHPTWRADRNNPATATRVGEHKTN